MERSALAYGLEQVERREQDEPTLGDVVHELFHPEKNSDDKVPERFRSLARGARRIRRRSGMRCRG